MWLHRPTYFSSGISAAILIGVTSVATAIFLGLLIICRLSPYLIGVQIYPNERYMLATSANTDTSNELLLFSHPNK